MSEMCTNEALLESFDIRVEEQNRPKIYTDLHRWQKEF
jgi:hypothetical protein